MASNKRELKAYARFDGSGRIVPGSTILRKKMPKVGRWKELQTYQCCNLEANCISIGMQAEPEDLFGGIAVLASPDGPVTVVVNWGDGAIDTLNLDPDFGDILQHEYNAAGVYNVSVCFTNPQNVSEFYINNLP